MARRLLYVGPDDEIADLVSRVRSAASGDEVGFVVPLGAGVFQTPLNFRLINQMAARQGVTAAIVSADPRTQQLARDAGIGICTSASAYEQDIAMGGRRPLGGQLAGGAALAAGAVASAIPPAPSRTLGAPVTPPSGMAGSPLVGEGSPPAPPSPTRCRSRWSRRFRSRRRPPGPWGGPARAARWTSRRRRRVLRPTRPFPRPTRPVPQRTLPGPRPTRPGRRPAWRQS